MPIIIRLQNLPWTANSLDIRRYFAGLTIPEGGVHIVGGEKGDAFIAFGTDEDARQAMERDGGKIKDAKVKLILSSRTQMTLVIEQARNQNLSMQVPPALKAAAATDSDRRRDPSPRKKEREKSPSRDRETRDPRDRERRRSSKRDRSRSRSRSPPRKNKERERDSDRRSDRSRRDDRHGDDLHDRYKSGREFAPREQPPDRRPFAVEDKMTNREEKIPPRQNVDMGKTFDARMGSTPQTYSSRQMAETAPNFSMRQETVPQRNIPYLDPQRPEVPPSYYPNAMSAVGMLPETKSAVEPLPAPEFISSGAFPFDKRAAVMGNYESKRPSPTPATSAPNVGSSAPYAKDYGMPDPYSSNIPRGYGEYPGEYSRAQTAERGTVPAVPNDRRVFHSNPPAYGAEPHARYDLIPEANQAGRSSNTPAPKEMAGRESSVYGKMLPTNMPVNPPSNAAVVNQSPRRSRFDNNYSAAQENRFHTDNGMKADPRTTFLRHNDGAQNLPKAMDSSFVHPRDRPNMGNEALWPPHASGSDNWNNENRGMMMQHHSSLPNEYDDSVPMDIEEENLAQLPPFHANTGPMQNRNFVQHTPEGRIPSREHYGYHNKRPIDDSREGAVPANIHGHFMSESVPGTFMTNQKNFPLTVEITGLAPNASENNLADLFRGIFLPRENIKMVRNPYGKGSAYVKFLNIRDFEEALSRNRSRVCGSIAEVFPCSLAVFNNAPSSAVSHRRAPEATSGHPFHKGNDSSQMRKASNYPPVDSEPPKKSADMQNRRPIQQDTYHNRPSAVIPQKITEVVDITKTQAESAKIPGKQMPQRRPESVPQRKPDVPQRKAHETAPQEKPIDNKSEVKSLDAQRKKEPDLGTVAAPMKEKSSEPPSERKSSEQAQTRKPAQPQDKQKNPECSPQRKLADPRQNKQPSEPVLPQRGDFGTNHPKKPLIPRKHPEPMSPRKSFEHQRKPMEHNSTSLQRHPTFHRSNLEPCEEDLCVELRGLSYNCHDDEIIHFFDGLGVLDIYVESGPDGRATGVGFVEFATPADFHAALDLNGKRMGHRCVDVLVASKEIMAVARGQRPKPPLLPQGPPREMPQPQVQSNPIFCVAINDLPKHIKNQDIAEFFAEVNLIPRAIHIMLTPNKTPTGEAFAEFNTRMEFDSAVDRNGYILAGSRVTISPISYQDMVDILGSPPTLQGPPSGSGQLLIGVPESDIPLSRRALMPLPMDDEMLQVDDHRPHDNPHNRPDYHMNERARFDNSEPCLPGRPHPPRLRGVPPRPDGNRVRPRMVAPPRGPPAFRPRRPGPPVFPGPAYNGNEPADFGRPGCVVGIDNLHFRAGLEDLLDFFRDYDIDKNSIIRKYNENGHATGEARVAFNCHEDAVHAVRELCMKPILGRPISLAIV